jgi:choline dehydrogenase-like flavoprotein
MILDFNQLNDQSIPSAEFCIVGAGPAGITLALELGHNNRSVLLLEGGGREFSEESQDVYVSDVVGDPLALDLEFARLRYTGGSSGHWTGKCRPLDAIDFKKKISFGDAHWPIEKTDIDPYLDQASSILNLSQVKVDASLGPGSGIKEIDFSISTPIVRFGDKYREEISQSKNITLVENANLTNLGLDEQRVSSARIENYQGNKTDVEALHFVLAMGGIENSRILKWCNENSKGRLIDHRSPLGRYWMVHPSEYVADALVDSDLLHNRILGLTEEVQQQLSVLNLHLWLEPTGYADTKKLLKDLLCVAPKIGRWAAALVEKNLVCGSVVVAVWEQEPLEENRIELSDTKRDRFGIPRTELHFRKSERDLFTLRETLLKLNEYLVDSNRGRLKLHDWVLGNASFSDLPLGGNHHMGGTRMATNVSKGVVDSNCKVFGLENLSIAGSSVFPSGGHANPTLTIVQLSLRLAQHLLKL